VLTFSELPSTSSNSNYSKWFCFQYFWKMTAKFRFLSNSFEILKFWTWQWQKLKKSISQLPFIKSHFSLLVFRVSDDENNFITSIAKDWRNERKNLFSIKKKTFLGNKTFQIKIIIWCRMILKITAANIEIILKSFFFKRSKTFLLCWTSHKDIFEAQWPLIQRLLAYTLKSDSIWSIKI